MHAASFGQLQLPSDQCSSIVRSQIAADTSKLGSRHAKTINTALLAAAMGNLVVSELIHFHLQAFTQAWNYERPRSAGL